MVELAVAIIVLGVILVAFLPLVVSSVQLAVKNTAVAHANQIVSSHLDLQRRALANEECADAVTAGEQPLTITETDFNATHEVTCNGALATLTIAVSSAQFDGEELSRATTQVATR